MFRQTELYCINDDADGDTRVDGNAGDAEGDSGGVGDESDDEDDDDFADDEVEDKDDEQRENNSNTKSTINLNKQRDETTITKPPRCDYLP